jgi:hypothetical protein
MPSPVSTANERLTRYEGPSQYREHSGKIFLFDAGTDEIIAELTADAAKQVRASAHGPVHLTFNGRDEQVQAAS